MVSADYQVLTDEQAVSRVLAGETCLYELLMRRYNQRLFRIARSVMKDEAEAEDVVQDAWVRAYEHLDQFAGRSSFATWVTKIAYYEALSRARKKKRTVSIYTSNGENMHEPEYVDEKTRDPEQLAMDRELRNAMESAVDQLPETYRSVFILREVERLSTADTAECLNLSEEAVKTRLHRSRATLRRILRARIGSAVAEIHSFKGYRCDRIVAGVMRRIAE